MHIYSPLALAACSTQSLDTNRSGIYTVEHLNDKTTKLHEDKWKPLKEAWEYKGSNWHTSLHKEKPWWDGTWRLLVFAVLVLIEHHLGSDALHYTNSFLVGSSQWSEYKIICACEYCYMCIIESERMYTVANYNLYNMNDI